MNRKLGYSISLPPLPVKIENLNSPVIALQPQWKQIKLAKNTLQHIEQSSLEGDIADKNTPVLMDEVVYESTILVPQEYKNKRVFLRMDSVGCEAEVAVGSKLIRQHYGSYTEWDCDISGEIKSKDAIDISIKLKNKEGEISPYQSAGIHGGISMIALADCYIDQLSIQTKKDNKGSMILEIQYALAGILNPGEYRLEAILVGAEEQTVFNKVLPINSPQENKVMSVAISCDQILLWDSEHPNLYKLKLILKKDGNLMEEVHQMVGFRHVEKREKQVYWNNQPLKLRGINYREPLMNQGNRDIREELERFKQANINYIRGLFYPFSKRFLELCDEMGFYVEATTAVSDVDQAISSTQNNPEYRKAYLEQLEEMLVRDRSHVSILIWSLGSDCTWGDNFRQEYRLVKEMDPIRFVNFHYPITIPDEEPQMDIWSVNHVSYKLPLDEHYDHMTIGHTQGSDNPIGYATGGALDYDMPVLHGAFAHLPCYNRDEIQRDPGIHEFWGESIKRFWDKMWDTDGCLGGAVMAAVDEDGTFSRQLKDFNWGILDANHQPKPEYHHLKMAYAPVKITSYSQTNDNLKMTIENRFNHTDLQEVQMVWIYDGATGQIAMKAKPRQSQDIIIPVKLEENEPVFLKFYYQKNLVFEMVIRENDVSKSYELKEEKLDAGNYLIDEDGDTVKIYNQVFAFEFSKDTKLLIDAAADQVGIVSGGPFLQTTRLKLEAWKGISLRASLTKQGAQVDITGEYGDICRVNFKLCISKDGEIETTCRLLSLSMPMPHTVKANSGLDCGGLRELGIWYSLYPQYGELEWNRNGLWACYPEDHIGRNIGMAQRRDGDDFFSMKHHINTAKIMGTESNVGVQIISSGNHSLRLESQPHPLSIINDRDQQVHYYGNWHEMNDYCGNYKDTEKLSGNKGDYLEFKFTGTGIRVYGPNDIIYGMCDVYIDGKLAKEGISQYLDKVDLPGMSRGYEKRYGILLFSVNGLENSEHTIRIVVRGEKEYVAQNTYVSLDYMVVENPKWKDSIKMIINNDFNYPRLVWGNYMRNQVNFKVGDLLTNKIRLITQKDR